MELEMEMEIHKQIKQDENVHPRQKSFAELVAELVWDQPDIRTALIPLGNKANGNGNSILKYYDSKPPVPQEREFSHYSWQNELLYMLTTTDAHPRHIYWFVDLKGGAGKTEFGTYVHCKVPRRFWLVTEFRTMADIATVIDNALKQGWDGHCVIVDIPRQCTDLDLDAVYNAIESIKNGIVTVSKYQSKLVTLPKRPHVVVFSNVFPNVKKLSLDKWKLFELVHSNGTAQTRPDNVTARPIEAATLID